MPLTNKAPPQISDSRPNMRHRALFVTSRAAWRWNKMLLARENVDRPLASMVQCVSQCSSQWYSTCIVPVLRRQKHDTVCEGVGLRYFKTTVRSNRQTHRLDATLFQGTETRSNRLHQILILRYFRSYDRSNRPE